MMEYVALIFVLVAGVNCVSAQSNIRSVDFKNFTYDAFCVGEEIEKITVRDGEFSKETQEDGYVDRFSFEITAVEYGDIGNDKQEEAVILSNCNTGGTGQFSEGFVYGMKNGKPTLLVHIPGGDRAYGGLRKASVAKGLLVVESNDPGETGASCCPQSILTTKYRITAGKLVKIGDVSSRPAIPTQRVRFAAGTTSSTIKVKIAAGESMRFVVGAKARQTLFASVEGNDASIGLVEDVETKTGYNSFTAKLSENGNYTIEVSNSSDQTIEVTVTIRIN